jgi:hypothetical protein
MPLDQNSFSRTVDAEFAHAKQTTANPAHNSDIGPIPRALARSLRDVPLEEVTKLPIGRRLVFATDPTRMQQPLGPNAQQALRLLPKEQRMWGKAMFQSKMRTQHFDEDKIEPRWNYFASRHEPMERSDPYVPQPRKLLLIITHPRSDQYNFFFSPLDGNSNPILTYLRESYISTKIAGGSTILRTAHRPTSDDLYNSLIAENRGAPHGHTFTYGQLSKAQREDAWYLVTASFEVGRCDEEWRGHRALFDMYGPRYPLVLKDPTEELPNGFLPSGKIIVRVLSERVVEVISESNADNRSDANLDEPPPHPAEGPRLAGITAQELETAQCQEWTVRKRELWLELSKSHFLIFSEFATPERAAKKMYSFHSLPLSTQLRVRDRLWMDIGGKPPAPYPHALDNLRLRLPD